MCNGITTVRAYESANDFLGESFSGGVLDGLSVTNGFDSLLRRTSLAVLNSNTPIAQYSSSYDAASRLSTVSDGVNSAAYSYLANSALVDHIVFAHSGASVMTNQNTYDLVNRLTGKSSSLNFAYQYNTASQRTKVTLIDGSYWRYGYDALGQLTSANKYFWDGTPYAGQQCAKTDADKVVMAARLREETTMTIGKIAQRLKMGARDTLSAKLQERKCTNV